MHALALKIPLIEPLLGYSPETDEKIQFLRECQYYNPEPFDWHTTVNHSIMEFERYVIESFYHSCVDEIKSIPHLDAKQDPS